MTYQPSFSKETSIPVAVPELDGFGWLSAESRDGLRDFSIDDAPRSERPQRRVPDCDIIDVGLRPPSPAA